MAAQSQLYSYKSSASPMHMAWQDIKHGFVLHQLWFALAWEDLRQRFRRSYIGLLWTTISFGLFIFVKFVIFGRLATADPSYFAAYLTIGFFAWSLINAFITDACNVFVISENWIKSARLPLTLFVLQMILRNLILSAYMLIVVVVVILIVGTDISYLSITFLPIIAVYCLNGFWISFVLGAICARQRDVLHLVGTIMRVMFFLSPILWMPEQIGDLWNYLQYNPLAHFIIALRSPMIDGVIPVGSWMVVGGITAFGLALATVVFAATRKRIIFWL